MSETKIGWIWPCYLRDECIECSDICGCEFLSMKRNKGVKRDD